MANVITVDTCIIGGGPGGLEAATILALEGQKVAVINVGALMGYGIEGAFKSKAEFEITRQFVYAQQRPDIFGSLRAPSFDAVVRGTRDTARGLGHTWRKRLERLQVRLINGRACFDDAHTVTAAGQTVRAERFVIATGSRPRRLDGVPENHPRVLDSDTVNQMDRLPASLLILGAGVIGCEFASIFSALGSEVTLVDSQAHILSMEDPDLSTFVERTFVSRGIDVIPNCRFEAIAAGEDAVTTTLSDAREFTSEAVLLAVGRVPNTANLGLERAGVEVGDDGYIHVNKVLQTNVPHIYAVGDVGRRNTPVDIALVHVAQAEGRCAAHHIVGQTFNQNLDHVPYIIFTIPMIAGAGLNESVARERHGGVRIGKYPYGRNHRAHAMQPPMGFIKLIVGPPGDDRILGVRAVGRDADTLVSAASIMIERQLPYTYLLTSILPHPSLMECLQGAAHILAGDALAYEEGEEYDYGTLHDDHDDHEDEHHEDVEDDRDRAAGQEKRGKRSQRSQRSKSEQSEENEPGDDQP